MELFEYIFRNKKVLLEISEGVMTPSSYSLLIANNLENYRAEKCLDIGTGCGFLGMLLALNGSSEVLCTDISEVAIGNTNANALLNGVNNMKVLYSNMFSAFKKGGGIFDLIVFNPPSFPALSSKGLRPNFYAGKDGRKFIDILLDSGMDYLKENGKILFVQNSLSNPDKTFSFLREKGINYNIVNESIVEFRKEYYLYVNHILRLKETNESYFDKVGDKYFQKLYLIEMVK